MPAAAMAMRKEHLVTIIRQMTKCGQRMVIQKVSFSPSAFSDYLIYQQ
jgi:hypothetical protein